MISNNKNFLTDLEQLISYRSVKEPKTDNAPFGEPTKKALNFVLYVAQKMGFTCINYDNYFGEIVFGEGEEFGIIGHLDVVPEGVGWNTNPYKLTKIGNKFFGRGVVDDKAPTLMCLYALNEIKNRGIKPNKKIRLLLGCNEESGWECVKYFLTKSKFPKYGFSPDSDFPCVYAEKGIYALTTYFNYNGKFTDIKGGEVINAVPYHASAKGVIEPSLLKKYGLYTENGYVISEGKSAHASMPNLGVNAVKGLLKYMQSTGEQVNDILDYLFYDKLNITSLENEIGKTTLSPDLISLEDGVIKITCDLRIPYGISIDTVKSLLDSVNIKYDIKQNHTPLYVDKDSFIVKTLLNAYQQITNDYKSKPVALGGGTYASVFEQGVAFGPEFKDENSNIHGANEFVSEEKLNLAYNIYKKAILDIIK